MNIDDAEAGAAFDFEGVTVSALNEVAFGLAFRGSCCIRHYRIDGVACDFSRHLESSGPEELQFKSGLRLVK